MTYAASQEFETPTAFVGVVILGPAGHAITEGLRAAERRLARWYAHKA